jgi:hypothetical protein
MPEAPEVFVLAQAANLKYDANYVAHGKQLFTPDGLVWSFGLTGTVGINLLGELVKLNTGKIHGAVRPQLENEPEPKCQWLTASPEELQAALSSWTTKHKRLGDLLLDQHEIAGIGIAWGSEIAAAAGPDVRLDLRACLQPEALTTSLLEAMLAVRERSMATYRPLIQAAIDDDQLDHFITTWFYTLYEHRLMSVYKTGTPLVLGGRTWWVQ